jgi:hypothetical protein
MHKKNYEAKFESVMMTKKSTIMCDPAVAKYPELRPLYSAASGNLLATKTSCATREFGRSVRWMAVARQNQSRLALQLQHCMHGNHE